MPDLRFQVEGAEAVPFAAAPMLAFKLRIENADPDETIQTIVLRCQIQIEATSRNYTPSEQRRLRDLFGEPDRWSHTLRPTLWTHANTVVTQFSGSTLVELPVACTFDHSVAATKYFAGLEDGEVPLNLQFSGTVFYEGPEGRLQAAQVPWDREAKFRLPLKVWREMMQIYYPNQAWLCLRWDVFERLYGYKVKEGIPTWEQAVERLLDADLDVASGKIKHKGHREHREAE